MPEPEQQEQPLEATPAQKKSLRRIKIALYSIISLCVALSVYLYIETLPPPPHKYDALAQCIAHSSTTFFGAFWCPHCADQKTKFGTGAPYLPYVECANPDLSRTQVCIDNNVTQYPTWVFKDGSRAVGVQTPEQLAQKTGCSVTGSVPPTSTPAS